MAKEKINIGDFSLAVRIEGDGKKGDIMLIHCLGLSNRVFDHQIDSSQAKVTESLLPM
jgi:hypothetical protein